MAGDDELVASVSRDPAVWCAVRAALDALEASTEPPAVAQGGERRADGVWTMPWFEYSPQVDALHDALGRAGLITPLADWMDRHDPARFAGPDGVRRASVADLVRLVTATFRGERFSEGTIAAALDDGTLPAAVRRLLAEFP